MTTLGLTAVALVAVASGTGAAAAVRRGQRLGLGAVLWGVGAAAAVGVAGGAGVQLFVDANELYGLAHLVYLGVTVSVPGLALGLGVLAAHRGAPPLLWAALVVALLPAPLGFYATHVEPYRLRVDHHVVAIDPARAGDDDLRIAVLADLQIDGVGDHERRAVDEILAADPDLVLITGDLFQATEGERADQRDAVRALLGRLEAPHGVWFVRGDADGGGRDDLQGAADDLLEGLDITVLNDEVEEISVGDRALRIGGTRLDFASATADAVRADLLEQPDDGAITLLVSHRPDTVLGLPAASRVDLTVAGHTHGGQVVLPVIGPIATLSDVPRDVARGGLHQIDGNTIYVSSGVGMERGTAPQVRFLSRPSVGILTLRDS